jgi:mannitol/fructose-specific phosphotransferase system IIA component (Ntr-type)
LKLKDYIDEKLICLLKGKNKEKVLLELINLICQNKEIGNKQEIKEAIFYREKLMSTGIGLGIGVPHIRIKGIKELIVAVGIKKEGVKGYETIDNIPVKIVVMIVAGEKEHKLYIKFLYIIVSNLKNNEVREKIIKAKNEKELYEILIFS